MINKKILKNEEGFTLIELLVVIVIIGVLAAIALPIFLNQQKASYMAVLKTDIKNSIMTVQTWISTHPNEANFNLIELQKMLSVSSGTSIALHGVPTDFCVQGSNRNSEIRGIAVDDPSKPSYMLFSNLKGGKAEQKEWASGQSCYTYGKYYTLNNGNS